MNTAARTEQPLEQEVSFEPGALAVISKAEIDMQIATAHRFPRVTSTFLSECEELVTLNEAVADECIYSLPGRGDNGQPIEGPSSRFAEVVAHAWGNCRSGARVIGEEGDFIVAQGAFHDLQKNVAISYEVRRRIVNKKGFRFSPDMIGVTANAACSIAIRNAVLKGIPKAFWAGPYEAARRVVLGDYQTLDKRRLAALDAFKKLGVAAERIYDKFGVKGIEDLTLEIVFQLRTMLTAIRDGDTNVDEQFPKGGAPAASERSASNALKAAVTKTDAQPEAKAQDKPRDPDPKFTLTPGTVEKRDEIVKAIKDADTAEKADEIIQTAAPYEWTAPDRAVIDGAYNQRTVELL